MVKEKNLWLCHFLKGIRCMNLTNGLIVIIKDNVGALETVSANGTKYIKSQMNHIFKTKVVNSTDEKVSVSIHYQY